MGICESSIFEKIFREVNPSLQAFLRAKGLDLDTAADLTQDAFVRLYDNCKKVTAAKAKSYLFTVASNLNIDRARRAQVALKARPAVGSKAVAEDPQYILEETEFKQKLELALETMSVASREVFVLSRLQDMKYAEIADRLGLSIKAVEKRMSNALKHLVAADIIKKR